jgi:uncharacterized membrane protein YedE/YeeE
MKGRWLYVVAGFVFAVGLALSGMTQPAKVSGFLDVAGAWDPSLAWVMGGAVAVYFAADRLARGWARPRFAAKFPARPSPRSDARLIAGAAIFGVGWGLSGFCPGPALVSVGAGVGAALWFVPAMLAGMALQRLLAPRPAATPGEGDD